MIAEMQAFAYSYTKKLGLKLDTDDENPTLAWFWFRVRPPLSQQRQRMIDELEQKMTDTCYTYASRPEIPSG